MKDIGNGMVRNGGLRSWKVQLLTHRMAADLGPEEYKVASTTE